MQITPEMAQGFREFIPAFADVSAWPESLVITALCEAATETGGRGWGGYEECGQNFKRRGMFYYAAHWLATNYGAGGINGTSSADARLNVAGKSVGDESINYRVAEMMDPGNDWLTYTNYGQQFYRLKKRAGMGARAV